MGPKLKMSFAVFLSRGAAMWSGRAYVQTWCGCSEESPQKGGPAWETKTLKREKVSSWPEATRAAAVGARASSDPVTTSAVFTQRDVVSQTRWALSLNRLLECVPLLVDRSSFVEKWRV